jgi:hypothetical protein
MFTSTTRPYEGVQPDSGEKRKKGCAHCSCSEAAVVLLFGFEE